MADQLNRARRQRPYAPTRAQEIAMARELSTSLRTTSALRGAMLCLGLSDALA